jgi:hypothetical protein
MPFCNMKPKLIVWASIGSSWIVVLKSSRKHNSLLVNRKDPWLTSDGNRLSKGGYRNCELLSIFDSLMGLGFGKYALGLCKTLYILTMI